MITRKEGSTIFTIGDNFKHNLALLIRESGMKQKEFAEKIDIAESTLSGYLKGTKSPTLSFLCKIKEYNPAIDLDQFLFEKSETAGLTTSKELEKYSGIYYVYYLDSREPERTLSNEIIHEDPGLNIKKALLYVNKYSSRSKETDCIGFFNLSHYKNISEVVEQLNEKTNFHILSDRLQAAYPYSFYSGTFKISHENVFIALERTTGNQDQVLIALHHIENDHPNYIGGLGTLNSSSSEKTSNPTVQIVALTRVEADDFLVKQIKKNLEFHVSNIDISKKPAVYNMLNIVKQIYSKDEDSLYSSFSQATIDNMLMALLQSLINDVLSEHKLSYYEITQDADSHFYKILKEREEKDTYGEQQQ